jgi:hypothetical protein
MIHRPLFTAALLSAAALMPLAQAQAAGCAGMGGTPLGIGTVVDVPAGPNTGYALTLAAGEGVIIDLTSLAPTPAVTSEGEGDEHEEAPAPRSMTLCSAKGAVLAPQPGEVFEKGGSVSAIDGGERLRFVAPAAGRYTLVLTTDEARRELLVRRRELTGRQASVIPAQLDGTQSGSASSAAPMVYSFSGTAGQWVELKSTSDKDTLLRLAGPDRDGNYSKIAENDDSDGLNPIIRRKLTQTGTYYLQVDSLSDEAGEFALTLKKIDAPLPPPPPAALRPGASVSGKLESGDDVKIYALQVIAGHSYRIDTAPGAAWDIAVAIGLPNPVEPDYGGTGPDASFSEVKSQDSGTRGGEKLTFTARSTGQLLVKIKSFGLEDSDGSYTLGVTDLGM